MPAWCCIDVVGRNNVLVMHGSLRVDGVNASLSPRQSGLGFCTLSYLWVKDRLHLHASCWFALGVFYEGKKTWNSKMPTLLETVVEKPECLIVNNNINN